MSYGAHMNESWHTHEWVIAHIWMSHGAQCVLARLNQYARSWDWVIRVPIRMFVGFSHMCANTHVRGIQSHVCQYACSWDSVMCANTCVPIRMFVGFSHMCANIMCQYSVRQICQSDSVPTRMFVKISHMCANTQWDMSVSVMAVSQMSVRHVWVCHGAHDHNPTPNSTARSRSGTFANLHRMLEITGLFPQKGR